MVKTCVVETPKKKLRRDEACPHPPPRPFLRKSAHHAPEKAAQRLRRWVVPSETPGAQRSKKDAGPVGSRVGWQVGGQALGSSSSSQSQREAQRHR